MDTSIDRLGIDRVLQRGTGTVVAQGEGYLLVRDSVSGAWFLDCADTARGLSLLDGIAGQGLDLLMTTDVQLGRLAYSRYGFADWLECVQVAYYGPPPLADSRLQMRVADLDDLPSLTDNYDLLSPRELAMVLSRGSLWLGYAQGHLVGFVGEHLEGSMGLLHVLPPYRRQGYGAALERFCIANTMRRGFVPFGQVEKDNVASLCLQKKLGMTLSNGSICWMWR